MKLLRIGPLGRERPALLDTDGVLRDASELIPDDYGPSYWIGEGPHRLAQALSQDSLPRLDSDGVRVGAPVTRPGKVIGIGLNYVDHTDEAGMSLPTEPIVFFKASNTVVGPNDDVLLPVGGYKTDWEVELGVVMGANARYLKDESEAEAAIAGYCLSNDVSERSFQLERGGQWVKGKSCETFNPLGPWLVTSDEIDVDSLGMWLEVNGERVQAGNTRDMVFSARHIVWYLSQFMVLEPGDLINTGTPAGVGLGLDPPRFLQDGDVMELSIEGLGVQRQVCRRASV